MFGSVATKLVGGDSNGAGDVFAHSVPAKRQTNKPAPDCERRADAGGDEGPAIPLAGSVNDLSAGDTIIASWSVASRAPWLFADAITTIACTDDGVFTATLTIDDGQVTASDSRG